MIESIRSSINHTGKMLVVKMEWWMEVMEPEDIEEEGNGNYIASSEARSDSL